MTIISFERDRTIRPNTRRGADTDAIRNRERGQWIVDGIAAVVGLALVCGAIYVAVEHWPLVVAATRTGVDACAAVVGR